MIQYFQSIRIIFEVFKNVFRLHHKPYECSFRIKTLSTLLIFFIYLMLCELQDRHPR